MAKGGTWLKRGVLVTFVLAAICCAVLALQVLCKESNIKAGITTLSVRHYSLSGFLRVALTNRFLNLV